MAPCAAVPRHMGCASRTELCSFPTNSATPVRQGFCASHLTACCCCLLLAWCVGPTHCNPSATSGAGFQSLTGPTLCSSGSTQRTRCGYRLRHSTQGPLIMVACISPPDTFQLAPSPGHVFTTSGPNAVWLPGPVHGQGALAADAGDGLCVDEAAAGTRQCIRPSGADGSGGKTCSSKVAKKECRASVLPCSPCHKSCASVCSPAGPWPRFPL